jgi:hypothetical protein
LHLSMTAAITDAVEARLAGLRAEAPKLAFDVDEVLELLGEIGDRMGKEYLDQDFDALLYDEKGLPK